MGIRSSFHALLSRCFNGPITFKMDTIRFDYQFKFDDGTVREFRVDIDPDTMVAKEDPGYQPPEWAKMEVHQCSHCPYNKADKPYCPVAKSIARVAEAFKLDISYTETTVMVRTENRFYGKRTDIQIGLQSLFGLMMATADCSHMDLFKPMARYHLPFSTLDETVVRIIGKYLISQYLKVKKGEKPDYEMQHLVEGYANVSIVNRSMIQRVRSISKGDADKNAIVILDGFAALLPMELQTGLETLAKIFKKDAA